MIEEFVLRVAGWPPPLAYGGLALSAFLENVVPPVPGDLVVVISAYLAGRGALHWLPVYLATCLGGTAGFLVMFAIGRHQGRAFLEARTRRGRPRRGRLRVFSSRRLDRAEAWLQRWGIWLVIANRFLSGVRSVIALAAGVGRMGWLPVTAAGLASMLAWNGLLLWAGLTLGENWGRVADLLASYNRILLGLAVVVAALLAVRYLRRRRRPPDDRPHPGRQPRC